MLLFVVALWNGNSLALALDLWNLRIRIHSPDYRRIALHFIWCGRLEGNSSFPEQVLSAFSRWLARMASRRPSSGRDCVGSVRFLQTYPWLGRAFSLGDQGALRVFKQRSNSTWILLKSWTRVQSSGVSAWHTSYRALVVFVDGPAASILGQNNFWDLLRRRRGLARSTCRANFRSSVATILLFIPFLTSAPGGVIVGYADFPLSIVYLAGLGYLLLFLVNDDSRALIIYSGCLALLPWIKREGLILWGVLAFLGFIVSWRRAKLARFGISLLPGIFLMVSWRVYLAFVHSVPSSEFSLSISGKLTELAARIGPITRLLLVEVSNQADWSIFWLAAALAVLYLVFRFRTMQSWILIAAVIAPIGLYCATYLFTTWSSYTAHVTSSLPRLLLQIIPVSLLAIATVLPLRLGRLRNSGSGSLNNSCSRP